ncbi:MAG: hypothetical protein Q8N28_01595 [bacterium]|nr:hypothetical protein [bacterium]
MSKLSSIVKSQWLIVFVILIIASFLRLYNIVELPPGLYPDEAIYANNGVEAWETGNLKVFYPENNGREGLWPNIIGFFIVKFGHEPWVPRSVAAVFGILTVLGTYFLTRELFKLRPPDRQAEFIALLSSFLLAVSFWHILFSRIGFRAIMAPFFLVWGIYFLLASLNKLKSTAPNNQNNQSLVQLTGQGRAILFSLFGGIFYGFGFHTYIAYRATPLLILTILFYYWFGNKNWQIRKKILLVASGYILIAIIVAAPLGLYFLQNPQDFFGRTTQISVFNSPAPIKDLTVNILKTAGMFNFSGDYNWRHNYAGKPELFWPVGILFIIGTILGTKSILRKSDFPKLPFLILFAWLIIAALPVVVSNEGMPHALRAIIMIPPIFILAGFGGVWLYEQFTKLRIFTNIRIKIFLLSTFYFLLSILVFEAYNTYFIKWGQNYNVQGAFSADYVQIGRELNSLPKETPKYVIVEAGGVDVRGIPMPAQTVMFITDTFTPEKQKEKNLFYILPEQKNQILENGYVVILN